MASKVRYRATKPASSSMNNARGGEIGLSSHHRQVSGTSTDDDDGEIDDDEHYHHHHHHHHHNNNNNNMNNPINGDEHYHGGDHLGDETSSHRHHYNSNNNDMSRYDSGGNAIARAKPSAPYFPKALNNSPWYKRLFSSEDNKNILLILLSIAAFATRFYDLSTPNSVAWDETHFGKFANGYIKGEFFFDVHPPLGKMLIAFAGAATGYKGEFEFKNPGQAYEETRYTGMRAFCAFLGALIVPLMYSTIVELGFSTSAGLLGASFILFETGTLALSRYILLDPLLMFFIQLSVYCLAKFFTYRNSPFSDLWWVWMALTGISLSCAFSVKWVGLFVILFAGLTTAKDIWDLLGDLTLSKTTITKHFFARVLCLIIIPAILYAFFFYVHFILLYKTGPGDGFMSSRFQTTLVGNELNNYSGPREIAYGSIVSIKNHRSGGALLHSHAHAYPETHGPQQQQVTAYSHKDSNNHFIIKKVLSESTAEKEKEMTESIAKSDIEYIKHGSIIRLEHVNTKRNIHSHREKAPLTTRHFQVSCYGVDGVGDANDNWRVEIVDGGGHDGRVQTLITRFRLIHVNVGCALHSHGKNLPKWGYEQLEVTCNPNVNDNDNLWNIEMHQNERLPKAEGLSYRPSFFSNLYEIHVAMAQVNNGLKPKENEITSRPWQWPINYKGQRFTGWGDSDVRVYLLGNPIIFTSTLISLGVYVLFFVVDAVITQRGYREPPWNKERKAKLLSGCSWLLIGWALHYFPFFVMGRVLYFHHYFPALLFSCMIMAIVIEYFIARIRMWTLSPKVTVIGVSIILSIGFVSFIFFSPLSYGMTGPTGDYLNRKWMDSWEL